MENKAAVAGLVSNSTVDTKSPKLLNIFVRGRLNIGSESQIHLTKSHNQRQWIVSSGCSSHKLQTLLESICCVNRLHLVGNNSFEALHVKCLTLFGTFNFQILFQKGLQPFVLDELRWEVLFSSDCN